MLGRRQVASSRAAIVQTIIGNCLPACSHGPLAPPFPRNKLNKLILELPILPSRPLAAHSMGCGSSPSLKVPMNLPRTNAAAFQPELMPTSPGWRILASSYLRRVRRHLLRKEVDDYDWTTYDKFYGPQNQAEERYFTHDLSEVDYHVIDGCLFTLADAKPVDPWHRVLFETIVSLPDVKSVHEAGCGGGKLIVNLGRLLAPEIALGASDIGEGQLALFRRNWPAEFLTIAPSCHDITLAPLPDGHKADVIYCATVLMHIRRSGPYLAALENLLMSARKFVVLIENWTSHPYVSDLQGILRRLDGNTQHKLRGYDSGSAMALVIPRGATVVPPGLVDVDSDRFLRKYF